MKTVFGIGIILCAIQVNGTQIAYKDLTNLVADADHVVIGTVARVDMVTGKGKQVIDESGQTGPGIENQLRLHVEVAKDGVLATATNRVPERLMIRLWQGWHDTLGNRRKETEGKTFIFLLKGSDFSPVYPGLFMRQVSERQTIEELLKKRKSQNPQGGVNGSQPIRLETNRTSSVAGSRHSP